MPDRERKQSTTAAELAVLLAAGDNRAAAARARQVLSTPSTVPGAPPRTPHRGSRGRAKREADGDHTGDQGAAREALSLVKPERAVALMFAACVVLLVLATVLGLRS
jgi:hypothetical protein